MPSASQPDPSGEGEVVEVFTGDSLEEAMAAAVAALGPALTVRRARKVRAGVRGLLGRDRYEVLAVPPADGSPEGLPGRPLSEDAVGSALDALLEAADEQEAGGPAARPVSRPSAERTLSARPSSARLPDPPVAPPAGDPAPLPPAPRSGGPTVRRGRPAGPADVGHPLDRDVPEVVVAPRPQAAPGPVVRDEADETPVRGRRGRSLRLPLSERSPHPDPEVADHDDPAPTRRRRRTDGPAATGTARPGTAPFDTAPPRRTRESAPTEQTVPARDAPEPSPLPTTAAPTGRSRPRAAGWSRAALSALGVPGAVLDALPSPAPRDDLAWVVALTAAIEAAVPAPGSPDEEHPVVVSGYGLAGAVAVLDAGSRGLVPGTITHAGRTAPATATELALVLRHHLTGGA